MMILRYKVEVPKNQTKLNQEPAAMPALSPGPLRWHINKCLCNKRKGGMDLELGQFRMILKKKKIQREVASVKPQATSNKRLKQQALDKLVL